MTQYEELVRFSMDNRGEKMRYKTEIGPTLASALYANRDVIENFGFRQVPIDKLLADQYTQTMSEGGWKYGINSIDLGIHKGRLFPVNGNHTLFSIMSSGKTVTMDVWVNVPPSEFPLYDIKRMGRSPAEQLYIGHKGLTRKDSSILGDFLPKAYLAITDNTLGKVSASTVSDKTIEDFYLSVKTDADKAVQFVQEVKGFRPNIVALIYFLCLRQGLLTESVLSFLTDLRDVDCRRGTPASKVILKAAEEKKNFKQKNIQATLFYVVNRLLEGKTIGHLMEEQAPFSIRASKSPKTTARKRNAAAAGR